jgi:hypothetical protein
VVRKVTCKSNLDVSVYSVGDLMVFPSMEEFLETRFSVQPDFHLPGTIKHQQRARQEEENSQGDFIFDDFEVIVRSDSSDFARY